MKNQFSRYKLFIFDWDGTLSSLKFLRQLNERLNPTWVYRKQHALDKPSYPKEAKYTMADLKKRSVKIKLFAPLVDLSLELFKPKLHNDSREVLEELKKRNKDIVLFTNGAQYRVIREVEYLKLQNYFEMIVSAQELSALKPNPLGLRIIIKTLDYQKEDVIYVGDMVNDVVMAKYAGIASCAVACGFDSYNKLKTTNPDFLFKSIEELKNAL